MNEFLKIIGREELERVLKDLPVLLRRKFLRPALRAGLKVVLDAALPATPVLARPVYRRGKMIRQPGTLRKNLVIRASRDATRAGDVGAFVNIRPAKPADRGKYSPVDPFYWRFVTFKTKKNPRPREFMQAGAAALESSALRAVEDYLKPRLQALDTGPRR